MNSQDFPFLPPGPAARLLTFRHSLLRTLLMLGGLLFLAIHLSAHAQLSAGAAAVDVTPRQLPVLINGGFTSRSSDTVKTNLHARAIVLADGRSQLAIVVVDSCMLPRPLLDEVKALASQRTGIPPERILISATHTHSAPSSMACLGTPVDPVYPGLLRTKIVEAIASAQAHLEPAQVGFAQADASAYNGLRPWIRRPDRIALDPFGNPTVRANSHAARNWDDVVGEAGPKDPDLALISLQARDGRPIAVLANFSVHYFGDRNISADYFGLFSEGLRERLARETPAGKPPFVGIMSHGCSGDISRSDYTLPAEQRNDRKTIEQFAEGLLNIATRAYSDIKHRTDADLAMAERRLTLKYRVPDKQRLEWAQRIVAEMGSRLPKNHEEVYAQEQVLLHERQQTEIVVQALRIGNIGIATTPTETYAVTGLKIKAASPLAHTIVFDLANGGDGYIPPPEQHLFGGYTTFAARSAGLEVTAEPKIAETAIQLLEQVAGKPRREYRLAQGPAAQALLKLEPAAWWPLNEFTGPHAADASGHQRDAVYEREVAYYLTGPHPKAFTAGEVNRAPHFVGGRLRARLPDLGERYTVSLWLWNGMPSAGRDVSGWFVSRERDWGLGPFGDHLGVGGTGGHTGKLIFFHGNDPTKIVGGKTEIPRWQWQHVAFVRDAGQVRVYLNGRLELEAPVAVGFPPGFDQFFFGGRSDHQANWEGRLDEIAIFKRALTPPEIAHLALQ